MQQPTEPKEYTPRFRRIGFLSKIRGRLFVLLLVLLIPVLITQTFVYVEQFASLEEHELDENLEMAQAVAEMFNGFVRDVLGKELTIGLSLTSSPPPSDHQINRLLQRSKAEYGSLRYLHWLDPDGYIIASTMPRTSGTELAGARYIMEIIHGSEWTISNPKAPRDTKEATFHIARGIYDDNRLLGIVVAGVDPEHLEGFSAIRRAHGGSIALFDGEAAPIFTYPSRGTEQELHRSLLSNHTLVRRATNDKAASKGILLDAYGKEILVGISPISPCGWAAAGCSYKADVMKPAVSSLVHYTALNLVVAFSAFLTALLISHTIAAPILQLRNHAQALGRGEKVQPLGIQSPDELRELEQTLQDAHEKLEHRVQERTLQLERANEIMHTQIIERLRIQEDLQVYMKKLEQSNQALKDFASIASHDLREPLRKIQTFGNRLVDKHAGELGGEARDYLTRMISAANRMERLLNALLDYARIETRNEAFTQVHLESLIKDVLADIEIRIEQTGAQIEILPLPMIEADASQIRQLFQNLVANAIKFHRGDRGEKPEVRIFCCNDGSGDEADVLKGFCRICVQDNGIGFEEQYLDRIFAPFQRLHGRSAFEGTGMGLAICKKITQRHGGDITAKSSPGEGSTFIISLPLKQQT